MQSVRWPTGLADAGALACAAALFAAIALEIPARAEWRAPGTPTASSVATRSAPAPSGTNAAPAPGAARAGG